jgi:hypothetical protein
MSQVSCSLCSKISKKSVMLPCGDSSCEDHLHETIVVDKNKIKCQVCDREFFIGDSRILPNKTLQNLIEMSCHFNSKEKQIPRSMEERVRVFNKFSDDYEKAKNELASFSFDNFNKN